MSQEKTVLKVAKAISEKKSIKLTPGQRRQAFDQETKNAAALIGAVTALENKFDDEFPGCSLCDGIEHVKGSLFVSYGKAGKAQRAAIKKAFDLIRTNITHLANGKAVFVTPNSQLEAALSGAGYSSGGGKKKGGKGSRKKK